MLYSREFNFVFSKTYKTAGTSVEVFLQQFCAFPDELANSEHSSPCVISERGVVGYRGAPGEAVEFWNHMSLADIRARLGREYDDAVKVTTIRNPYDAVVSAFHFRGVPVEEAISLKTSDPAALKRLFTEFSLRTSTQKDRFFIDTALEIDAFIRFEHLESDLAQFCRNRGISCSEETVRAQLPRHKASGRGRADLQFSDYFTADALAVVNDRLGYWFELGGYAIAQTASDFEELARDTQATQTGGTHP